MPACHAGGHEFESRTHRKNNTKYNKASHKYTGDALFCFLNVNNSIKKEAISLVYMARKSGVKSGERVSPFARQQNLFVFDDGATVSDYTNATIMMLADIVNGAKVTELKKTISIYNDRARDAASGQSDIFSAELKTKEDILKEVNELLNYGTEEAKESALSRADASRRASSEPVGAESVEQDGTAGVSREGSADVEDSVQAALTAAEQETNTEPTEAQKEAGNYKKGHVKIDGYNITIENPKGSERSGQDKDGKKWSITMNNTYGYILGTEGVDGDHIDVFLSDNPSEGNVYVVDQVNADGSFDEHKVMYGFPDIESARKAYLSNYEEGWQGLGNITGVSKEEFKKWVDSSHRKTKPFAEYKNVKVEESNTETEEEVLPYNKENSERLSLESEKNADNSAVGYSVTLESKDGTLQRSIFYDGRLIAIQWQSGERIDSIHDVLRSAYNDAPAMNYDLYVPMKVGANESWEIDGREVLDADHGDIIRFHDEQEMIDFYLKNRNEIDRRNETMQPHSAETRETALRDGLIDKLRSAGIDVITDEEEAQRVLDADRERRARLMGSRVEKRKQEIAAKLEGKEMSDEQQAVVNVFTGRNNNLTLNITDKSGKSRSIVMRQGNELNAGTKHSIYRHYGTSSNVYTAEEIMLIPNIIRNGERHQVGSKVTYQIVENGVKYTVTTEQSKLGNERFTNFFTNKKPTAVENDTSNTDEQHVSRQSVSGAKLQKVSDFTNYSPVFYSNAEKAVEGISQNKATAEQWLAMIQKQGGLKAGEDKWLGLRDWLTARKGQSLTKEELLDYIRENQVHVDEVSYTANPQGFEDLKREYDGWLRNDGYDYAWEQLRERFGDDADIAFTDFGGDLEIDNPEAASALLGSEMAINSIRLDYTTEGLDNKREIALTVPDIDSWNENDEVHFGDAGQGRAVAWVRFGETTDSDGNRVLVIDEIQSKRHQEGRERGYITDEDKTARRLHDEYVKAREMVNDYETVLERKYNVLHISDEMLTEEEAEHRRGLWKAVQDARDADRAYNYAHPSNRLAGGIPDAPFEKNWHELAMKRMLRYAAENGFDKVAWTMGEQQAERYNIGGKIERIVKTDDHVYEVYLNNKPMMDLEFDEDGIYRDEGDPALDGKSISDVFGKSLAERLDALPVGERLQEDGLRMGGEGMKGFYDEILPRFMDKYGKKWGIKTVDVTLPYVEESGRTMHSVDVTPEMRESVMEGQPMFLRTDSGEVYGFTKDGKIYIDPRKATAETPVHEFTHLWADGLRKANPKAWEQLKNELEKEKDLFDYVKSLYPELSGDDLMDEVFAHFSGRRGAERLRSEQEKMMQKANGIFDKAKITTMFDKLKNMLHDFWAQARDLFAGKTEGIERLSAEDFADMALADLIKGEKPLAEGKKETRFNKAAGLDVRTYDNSNHQTRDEERVTLGELVSGDRQLRDMSDKELDSEYMRLLDVVEKPARIDKLRSSKPVEIKPSDYDGKYKLNAESAQKWIKDNLRGKHVINDTGETVEVSKIGAEEVTSHNRYDEAHLKSISKIPSMLENAVFLGEEANTKGNRKFDSYRYYAVGLNIDGVDYTAKIVIGVKQGKKYYDHRLTQLEKSTLIDMINQPASGFTTAENASLPPYANGKDKRLLSILQVNVEEISQSEQKMREILDEMKRRRGYDSNTDYQGSLAFNGAAPSRNAYFDSKEERMSAFKSGEFEGDYSLGDYMDNGLDNNDLGWQLANPIAASGRDKATLESIRNLMNVVKNKERRIKMYRAVDASIKENKFRNGDWITPSREYAERHIGLQEWKNGRVISKIKEYRETHLSARPSTYQVTKIEVFDEETPNTPNGSKRANGYVHVAKLLKDFEKKHDGGKKILDESKKADESTDLYRAPDESEDVYDAGRHSLEETLTQGLIDLSEKNRSDVGLRISAMKAISSNLSELRSAMSRQRDYDKSTAT